MLVRHLVGQMDGWTDGRMDGQTDGRTDGSAFPLGISLPDIMYIFGRPDGGILLSLGSGPPQGSLPRNYVACGVRRV